MSSTTLRIVVIGAGAVGMQLGREYALAGQQVVLCDPDPEATRHAAATTRLTCATDVADASAGCDVVVEAVAEELALKARLLGQAADAAPKALLVTSASLLRIGDVGRAVGAADRTVGMRFGFPPMDMGFVEVVPGEETPAWRVATACELVAATGKLPVVLRRDIHGSVWDRLQLALVRECAFLVEQGVISAEGVDEVVREGLARRWRHVGPLRALVLGGLDTWNALARNIAPELSNAPELPDLARFAVAQTAGR